MEGEIRLSMPEYDISADSQRYRLQAQTLSRATEKRSYRVSKRMLDIVCTAVGLLFCVPLFVIVAISLKLEDPRGPVFFVQERVGKDGERFRIYKFRSMIVNAEELLPTLLEQNDVSGAMFKMRNDPRVTKVGRFIRRTSIDELPQLWNVLKGDMSLVGPRPTLPRELPQYSPYDMQRFLVTPGCTGLWQISGRSTVGFKEMVELDLKYIENRTLKLDLVILFKTIRVLFGSKEAF